jgi:hypothetical protein
MGPAEHAHDEVRLRVVFSTASSSVMAIVSPFSMCWHTVGMACCHVPSGMWVVAAETPMLRSPSVLYTWLGHGLVMSRLVHLAWLNSIRSTHSSCRFDCQGAGRPSRLAGLLGGDLVVRLASLGLRPSQGTLFLGTRQQLTSLQAIPWSRVEVFLLGIAVLSARKRISMM